VEVVCPDSILERPVVGIGSDAFNTRRSLESIRIPDSVTGIGNAAFANCNSLKSIAIPSGVTYIGFDAFHFCTSLTSITLPKSLAFLGGHDFYGATNLVSIDIDPSNEYLASIDGVLYDKALTSIVECPKSKEGLVVLPATVTTIWTAFVNCTRLSRSEIPEGVTTIYAKAFENCPAVLETTGASPFAPGKPSSVRGDGQVQLSWAAPVSNGGLPVTDYTIQYSSNSGASWQTFSHAASAATSATVTGLTNGTAYLFRVASVNEVGTGLYSANSSAVTPATTPGAPTSVAGVRGNSQVQLSWTAPASDGGRPVKDYSIQYSTDGSSWQTFSHAASTATSATVRGLTNGAGYLFRVASVSDVGTGSFTTTSSSITPNAVPLPPTNIVATRGRGVVTVSWTTPVSTVGVRITDYRVQQSTNGGISWVTVGDGVSLSTRTVVSGLVMGRGYIFRVAAVGRSGAGDFSSPSAIVTPATVPTAPVGVLATGGLGQVALSWRAPTSTGGSPINQYIVQYSPSAGRWLTSTTVGSNTTTATVGGLLANRSYSLRVLAVNDMGNSPASRVVVAKTLRASPTLA
jgi:predicted phage tail protein